jgi:hypothetical protein
MLGAHGNDALLVADPIASIHLSHGTDGAQMFLTMATELLAEFERGLPASTLLVALGRSEDVRRRRDEVIAEDVRAAGFEPRT